MNNNKFVEPIEYRMSKKMFDLLVKTRSSVADKKMNPYAYVMKVVNNDFGLKGEVRKLHIEK